MTQIKEYKVNKKNKNTRRPLSNEQLKNIARDCYRGDIFTSLQIQNPNDIAMVFMPLMLMNPDQFHLFHLFPPSGHLDFRL